MSNPISTSQMKKALFKKGFIEQDGDHEFFVFYYNGKKTMIRTKISRGSSYKEYDDKLFGGIKKQLHLDSIQEVRQLLECPMSKEQYIAKLIHNNLIKDEANQYEQVNT